MEKKNTRGSKNNIKHCCRKPLLNRREAKKKNKKKNLFLFCGLTSGEINKFGRHNRWIEILIETARGKGERIFVYI